MSNRFATTQWNVVLAARDGSESQARLALESLCEAYWFPLYAYVRRRGQRPMRRAISRRRSSPTPEPGLPRRHRSSKGRFRSFLLASLEHFLSHERTRSAPEARRGRADILARRGGRRNALRHEAADRLTPERVFERRWGLTVMERAMERLQAESATNPPVSRSSSRVSPGTILTGYRDIAAALGMSGAAVKTAVHRLRQRYGRLLREEIAETVARSGRGRRRGAPLLAVIRPWQDPDA